MPRSAPSEELGVVAHGRMLVVSRRARCVAGRDCRAYADFLGARMSAALAFATLSRMRLPAGISARRHRLYLFIIRLLRACFIAADETLLPPISMLDIGDIGKRRRDLLYAAGAMMIRFRMRLMIERLMTPSDEATAI